ncbi:LytR/AlgR family response regulator transcription factor [Rhizosphaericola mali]|uniref:Response regulator transcription factor n=1 Tax=Rhizosphaericola mali TaxID=2545455 RepID=A0A5P2G5X6_9BACT|nr:LytTR family DNA-binding domain-containing protein [Rhizosphaericola mali]QES90677.1 response regulator transcription factor [Rhizosphaericola mali]
MNILIIEDELYTAQLLQTIIESNNSFIVVKILDSIEDSVSYLSRYQDSIDLIFMDIQLVDGDSFEIFKNVDVWVPIVFCTAYDEYTMKAIQNNGIDYILKPFEDIVVQNALIKYKKLIDSIYRKIPHQFSLAKSGQKQLQKSFLVQIKEKSIIVSIENIALFSLELETVYIYTIKGEKYPIYKSLEYVESVVSEEEYFKINRQMIVNRNAIVSIESYFNRKLFLHLNIDIKEKPIVSRLKVSYFKQWLESANI